MENSEKPTRFIDWRKSDKGDSVAWAFILIWGAFIILGDTLEFGDKYEWWNPWGLFFIGMGIIGLAGSVIRLLIHSIPNPSLWDFIFGVFFLLLGMGNKTGWIWAVALMVIGFSILRSITQHHKKK
jgi:hypothetical protein